MVDKKWKTRVWITEGAWELLPLTYVTVPQFFIPVEAGMTATNPLRYWQWAQELSVGCRVPRKRTYVITVLIM